MVSLDFPPAIRSGFAAKAAKQGWSHERDREVARLYMNGLAYPAIAAEVGCSTQTVQSTVSRLILRRVVCRRPGPSE